ncbi:MAG TPA: hypothetical protein VH000_10330, partial [Rhizomicrobium sp.]|nr:hypothetical protein [Rhizomicrobium sp.]
MRPELPWNVAGIPPEAREAARAAARREGLSVGEWMTRRILRGLSGMDDNLDRDEWQNGNGRAQPEQPSNAAQRRDTDDMLARVSRSEDESNVAYRRIEEQLRTLGRRIDSSERSHSENNRAMSKAAAEINIAAREQTQAFDQLGAHVVNLGDRLERVERQGGDGSRDAVKGLQNGLSRLADQVTQTAQESTAQIASLASNVESLATKLVQARSESENSARLLEQRIYGLDDRIRAAEKTAQAGADTLERAVQTIETQSAAKTTADPEVQRHGEMLTQFGEMLDRVTAKLAANEHQTSAALARLEDSIAKRDGNDATGNLDRQLQGIERALSDIAGRLDTAERNSTGAAQTVEEGLRSLTQRVDASEKRNRDAIAEMRNTAQSAAAQTNTFEQPSHAIADGSPGGPPMLDMPPFSDTPSAPPVTTADPFAASSDPFAPPPAFDQQPAFAAEPPMVATDAAADPFAPQAQPFAEPNSSESYLSAARRAAKTAAMQAETDRSRGPMGAFTWGANRGSAGEDEKKPARFGLIAGLALAVIVAIVAGVMLSQRMGAQHTAPANGIGALFNGKKPSAVAAAPQAEATLPNVATKGAAPGSPVVIPNAPAANAAKNFTVPATAPQHLHPTTPVHAANVPPVSGQGTQVKSNGQTAVTAAKPAQQTASLPPMQKLATLANQGSAGAQTALGLKYLDGDGVAQNDAEAVKWFERAAAQGEAVAEYRLGTLYERGRGMKADPAKATHWYEAAAKAGNRKAMHNLAVAYAEGAGEKKDYSQAARWFSKAANLGLADSEFNLAVLYERGLGVPQSLVDAYKWYAIAAA